MSTCVWIEDSVYRVSDEFDATPGSQDMADLTELHTFLRGRLTPLTPEQVEKQQAAQERARVRNERLFGESPESNARES